MWVMMDERSTTYLVTRFYLLSMLMHLVMVVVVWLDSDSNLARCRGSKQALQMPPDTSCL
jgi:hypothetical protein